MQSSRLMAAIVAALIAAGATAVAGESETVNGVTILRGRTPSEQPGSIGGASAVSGIGSGSSTAPSNRTYRIDRTGTWNATHTGSANAGGEFNNLPPSAGR